MILNLHIFTVDNYCHKVQMELQPGATPDEAMDELFNNLNSIGWFQCMDAATGKQFACNVRHVCFIRQV